MVAKDLTLVSRLRNQILAMCITALATGLGMNVLFINSIDQRMKSIEKYVEKNSNKIDKIVEGYINKNL